MRMRSAEALRAGKSPAYQQRFVRYSRISPNLMRAVLLAEDAGFWGHGGVDWDEIRASLERNIDRGEFSRGASTITQQLAKNLYLSPSRNPYRKLSEWMIARRLEAELSKQRILELYLNLIEWGDGIWGVEAAAQRYFGISASDLSVEQSALLAGAIINPRIYSPAQAQRAAAAATADHSVEDGGFGRIDSRYERRDHRGVSNASAFRAKARPCAGLRQFLSMRVRGQRQIPLIVKTARPRCERAGYVCRRLARLGLFNAVAIAPLSVQV